MRPKLPKILSLIAILAILLGGLGLACSCHASWTVVASVYPEQSRNIDGRVKDLPAGYAEYLSLVTNCFVAWFTSSTLLIAAGLALYSLQRWTRYYLWFFSFFAPLAEWLLLAYDSGHAESLFPPVMVGLGVLWTAFAALLLATLWRGDVSDAFAQSGVFTSLTGPPQPEGGERVSEPRGPRGFSF
jgi:hypothetical protein